MLPAAAPGGSSYSDAPSFSVPACRPIRDRCQVNGGLSCSASQCGSKTFALIGALNQRAAIVKLARAMWPELKTRWVAARPVVLAVGSLVLVPLVGWGL